VNFGGSRRIHPTNLASSEFHPWPFGGLDSPSGHRRNVEWGAA